ncbi:MAG: HAD-IA family hydrolase [Bacteroidales bacterium]|nr:HAD-IA family hydrolase [Bacteroidales bacterium]
MTEYKAIVLDMDGTLYHPFPVRICMIFELFFHYSLHLNKLSELFRIQNYRHNYESGNLQTPDSHIVYWMQKKPQKYVRFFRNKKLIEFAQTMQQRGTKIIVYSDYPLKEKLEALSPFTADFTFCANDVDIQCLKPDNKGLLHIVNVLNLPVEDIVFIGNRFDKDALCARKTGMDYLVLNHPFSPKIKS